MTDQTTEVSKVTQQTRVMKPAIVTESPQKTYETKKVIFRTYQIVWYILGVIEVLLAFRIFLKLVGANAFSGFADFIYTLSGPFALPFSGILGVSSSADSVFEWSTFIAMAVYGVVAYGIVALLQLIKPTNPEEVNQNVDNQ